MQSSAEVKSMMDSRYAAGIAYQSSLPFDRLRGDSIRATTLRLCEGRLHSAFRTLDVGSGEGGIASFWPHANILGVEISEVAVQIARKNFPDARFQQAAIEEFELGAGMPPFDLVVAQESIEHWTDVPKGLRAIHQALRPNGTFVLTTPNRDSLHCRIRRKMSRGEAPYCSTDHIHEFGFDELIKTVTDSGFVLEGSDGVGLLPYWTMEQVFGSKIRSLTDADEEVATWFEEIGREAPPEYNFIQAHRFRRESCQSSSKYPVPESSSGEGGPAGAVAGAEVGEVAGALEAGGGSPEGPVPGGGGSSR